MKKSNLIVLLLLIVAASLYRVWDGRPWGFAPQIAMALFAGSVCRDKKIAFLFPLLSMLISDALYQFLFVQGLTPIKGFYSGQWLNYLLIASVTFIGFFMNNNKISHVVAGSFAGAVYFFLVSNFTVWIGGGWDINNLPYPKTGEGLISCYTAAIPFFKWSLVSTLVFNSIFFGAYYLLGKSVLKHEPKAV